MSQPDQYTPDVQNIDDTEDFRTVIVNTDKDKESFQRFQFNLNWTLTELTSFLKESLNLPN